MNTEVMFSSKTGLWETPQDFFDALDKEFHFTLDVCALPENAKCETYYTPEQDGLAQPWTGVCWCNPPYGRGIGAWVRRAHLAAEKGNTVVMLLPARTDTIWFHEYIYQKREARFIKGRLRFGDGKNSAPFPSMVVVFEPRKPKTNADRIRAMSDEELASGASTCGASTTAASKACRVCGWKNARKGEGKVKTKILKIKGDWEEVVNDCRATVKKSPLGHEPSRAFRKKILIAEHSPIRDIIVKFMWPDIPYWVAMHWKTHRWESRVDSQRNDRQSRYDREEAPQKAPVDFYGDPNAQHLIDTWRKRLCRMASPETRGYAEDFKVTLRQHEPDIAAVLVPNCVYRCGCPEMQTCGWYDAAVRKCPELASTDIQTRYDAYNRVFMERERTDQCK